jgi:hypothetical protein
MGDGCGGYFVEVRGKVKFVDYVDCRARRAVSEERKSEWQLEPL